MKGRVVAGGGLGEDEKKADRERQGERAEGARAVGAGGGGAGRRVGDQVSRM